MEDLAEPPPANLLGNMQVDYIISEKPSLILRGSRKDVYHGIIDGNVTETSLGLNFQKTWPRFDDFLIIRLRKDEE
jgi:hypothetical protein